MTLPTPPVLPGLPILGNLLEFQRDRKKLLMRGRQRFGGVFAVRLLTQPMAVLYGAEPARAFFEKTDTALRMDKAYKMLSASFGEVGFTAPPEVYRRQRSILHMPFKGSKMGGYFDIMQEEISLWLQSLGEQGEVELTQALGPVVQNVAAHAFMGREFRNRMGRDFWGHYLVLAKALDPVLPPNLPLPRFIQRDRARVKISAMIREIISERRTSDVQHPDMLNELIHARYDDGEPVSDDDIIHLIMALMFAGHETTWGQAVWTVAELLRHPQYLVKVQAEIDAHLPRDRALTYRDFANLPHLEWAVYETTRLHPSADIIMRYVEEDVEVGGYRIPAGWVVMLSNELNQLDEQVFTQPDVYDPLRFSPERAEDKAHRHSISGFGGGVHKCTGMNFANLEMSLIAAMLLRDYELTLLTPNPQVTYALGAVRPEAVRVAYRRRADSPLQANGGVC
ncbi:cytochrome P450 [Aggregatilineales bacterium SYSU G02658]